MLGDILIPDWWRPDKSPPKSKMINATAGAFHGTQTQSYFIVTEIWFAQGTDNAVAYKECKQRKRSFELGPESPGE